MADEHLEPKIDFFPFLLSNTEMLMDIFTWCGWLYMMGKKVEVQKQCKVQWQQ